MKIVITGALGHIGSKLIRDVPENFPDAEIVMIDNMAAQRYCSLFSLPSSAKYLFLEEDIMKADLVSIFQKSDAVIHLAAITDATNSFENRHQVEQVNLHGTELVAKACAQVAAPMIFLSTTSVYGSQSDVVDEDCPVEDLKPQSPYAEAKLKSEYLLKHLSEECGLRFVALRLGTIFGASQGMRFHTAVNKFVWQACLGQPLTVWRTALHQRRPYLELNDAIRCLFWVIRNGVFDNGIYNVLTINATVNEIVEAIRAAIPDLQVKFVDTRIMNQLSYHVKSDKIQNLGFSFTGDLNRGIDASIRLLQRARSLE